MMLEKHYSIKERMKLDPIKNVQDLKNDLLPCFNEGKEFFIGLYLDSGNKVICREIIHIGGLNESIVDIRAVFKNAILLNANSIILAHNHPSGNLTPSQEDINIAEKLNKAGKLLGIPVLDHIIFNHETIQSYKEELN